jgi:predicted ribosome quality control (RQC) complex YloA/Tae2 family protein
MALGHAEVERVVEELGWVLPGASVEGFVQYAPRRFVLSCRQGASEGRGEYGHNVLVCLQAPHVRLHLTRQKRKAKGQRLSFGEYVRSRIEEARVVEVKQLNADRIVEFALDRAGERLSLVVELFPRGPHIELLDAGRTIVASLDGRRVGAVYEAPAKPAFAPAGPALKRDEPAIEAGGDVLYNYVLDERFAEVEAEELFEADKRQLVSQLRRERRRLARLVGRLEGDVERGGQWVELGRWGELLKSALGTKGAGRESVEVEDFSVGETVSVPLDATLGVRENMEAYFKRSRKLRRTLERAEREIGSARARLAEVERRCEAADEIGSPEALARFLDEHEVRLKPKQAPRIVVPKREKPAEEFRYFVSATGKRMYVGRSEAENDRLTVSFARGHDLWLHCHDYAGSHVVVALKKDEEADGETLLDAATLALAYSKARHAGSGEVIYTPRRYVTKPKRLPAGKVYVSTHKVMHLKLDEERLRKIKERTREE